MNEEEFIRLANGPMVRTEEARTFWKVLSKIKGGKRMLDIGTGWGNSSSLFAIAKPEWIIYTLDLYGMYEHKNEGRYQDQPCDEDHMREDIFKRYQEMGVIGRIVPMIGDAHVIPWELELDALFIDGDHSYDGARIDFEKFSPFVVKGGVIMFHDYLGHLGHPKCEVNKFVDTLRGTWEVETEGNVAIVTRRN